jgi:site-specific DNA recombinase
LIVLYKKVVSEVYKGEAQQLNGGKKQLLALIEDQNAKVSKARKLLLCEAIDADDFKIIKAECNEEIKSLENRLSNFSTQKEDIDDILEKACHKIGQLGTLYINGTIEEQQNLIGSIFTEKITFENNRVRTASVNEAIKLIYSIDEAFKAQKTVQMLILTFCTVRCPRQVSPPGLEPGTR